MCKFHGCRFHSPLLQCFIFNLWMLCICAPRRNNALCSDSDLVERPLNASGRSSRSRAYSLWIFLFSPRYLCKHQANTCTNIDLLIGIRDQGRRCHVFVAYQRGVLRCICSICVCSMNIFSGLVRTRGPSKFKDAILPVSAFPLWNKTLLSL